MRISKSLNRGKGGRLTGSVTAGVSPTTAQVINLAGDDLFLDADNVFNKATELLDLVATGKLGHKYKLVGLRINLEFEALEPVPDDKVKFILP